MALSERTSDIADPLLIKQFLLPCGVPDPSLRTRPCALPARVEAPAAILPPEGGGLTFHSEVDFRWGDREAAPRAFPVHLRSKTRRVYF